jgi:hypothetical protein
MPTAGTEAASGSLILEGQARPIHTLNQHPSRPAIGVHFRPASAIPIVSPSSAPKGQSEVYARSSLDLAMKDAFRKVRRFLTHTLHLSEERRSR